MHFRVDHIFKAISMSEFEQLYLDEPFNIALCTNVKLGRDVKKYELKDGHLSRELVVTPDRALPGPIAKITGSQKIQYNETLTYVFGSLKGTWRTVPFFMSDKIDIHGTFGFVEHPDGILRYTEGDVKVKVFGVGKIIEKFIVADIEQSYAQAAQFTQKWIEEKL